MTAVEKFKTDLTNWLNKNGFEDVNLCFGEDFECVIFDDDSFGVQVGVQAYPEVSRYFEQFLYEYGLSYTGIFDPVLCFIHELGHSQTIRYFNAQEQLLCELAKQFNHSTNEQDCYNEYWEVPDEFAANMWTVNFINNHIEAVEELCDIYARDWAEMFKDITIEDFLQRVA